MFVISHATPVRRTQATYCLYRRSPQLNPDKIDEILPAMTLDEKVSLLIGTGMACFFGDDPVIGETRVPGLGSCRLPTGPIRAWVSRPFFWRTARPVCALAPQRPGDTATYYSTAFPLATQLARRGP